MPDDITVEKRHRSIAYFQKPGVEHFCDGGLARPGQTRQEDGQTLVSGRRIRLENLLEDFGECRPVRNLPSGRQGLPSGVYFYQLRVDNFVRTKSMVLIK